MVQLAESIISAPNQSQNLASVGIHRDQRDLRLRSRCDLGFVLTLTNSYALGAVLEHLIINQLDAALDRLRCGALQVRIEGGVDPIGLFVHLPLGNFRDKRFPDQINKVRRLTGFHIGRSKFQGSGFGLICLFAR